MPKRNRISLVGQTFGRLIVVADGPINKYGATTSICLCECGKSITTRNQSLTSGHTNSCGCFRISQLVKAVTIHGHTRKQGRTQIFQAWGNMHQRCMNPNYPQFEYWGGKGIGIYKQWTGQRGFENFSAFMGKGKKGWSIHRVDNDAGYFPENMVWATPEFQMRHTSKNVMFTFRGLTACLADLCERFHALVSDRVVRERLKIGWDMDKAMFTPVNRKVR